MKSRFQIGPAKTRDGRDAFVTSINSGSARNVSGFMTALTTGKWMFYNWMSDGGAFKDMVSDHDLMPNVTEPEWTEFAVWESPNSPRKVNAEWIRPDVYNPRIVRLRLRFVDGKLEAEVVE